MSAPKLIEWSRDGRRASLACRYANRYPMVICGSLVLSLYSSCTCWIKLCMTLDSTWCNMYCTGDLLRLLIHGLASIFGSGRFTLPCHFSLWHCFSTCNLLLPFFPFCSGPNPCSALQHGHPCGIGQGGPSYPDSSSAPDRAWPALTSPLEPGNCTPPFLWCSMYALL